MLSGHADIKKTMIYTQCVPDKTIKETKKGLLTFKKAYKKGTFIAFTGNTPFKGDSRTFRPDSNMLCANTTTIINHIWRAK